MPTLSGNRIVPRSINASAGNKTIDLNLLLNQTCSVRNDGTIVVNGLVSGPKGFVISGSGVMDLKNNNTYSGDTDIRGGTLRVSGTGTLGSGASYAGNMIINGTFDYASSADQVIAGRIGNYSSTNSALAAAGAKKISVNGTGLLHFKNPPVTLSGDYRGYTNGYFYGSLEINSGSLRTGNNTDTEYGLSLDGLIGIHVGADGTFEYNVQNLMSTAPAWAGQSKNTTTAPITGSGDIVVMNGWLIASGRGSTFDGNITINSTGTLELTRKIPNAVFVNNGALVISPTTRGNWNGIDPNFSKTVGGTTTTYSLNSDYVLATAGGEGNVTGQLQAAGLGNAASDFSGFVAGRVALVQRGVASFATKVNNAVAAGASAVVIYNNTTGLTAPSVAASVPVIMVTQAIGEQLVADLAGGAVNVNINTGYEVGDLALPDLLSEMTGTGALVLSGPAASTLIVNATPGLLYTGTTNVAAGVLRIAAAGALPSSSGFVVISGTALELTGGISQAKNLTITGTGISSGGVVRNISGNNTLSGATTLTAASRINSDAGTLTIGGNVSGAFGLTVGGAGNTTINGVFSGYAITKDGAGTLELTAANTYANGTSISAGTLKLTGDGIAGTSTITNNSSLVVENNEGTTIPNSIGGTGTLIKNLNTRVISAGNLSHTGTTTINAGTLALGGGGSVGGSTGNFVVNAGATLEINRGANSTFSRPFSGSGSLLISTSNQAIFTSNLAHTGGTTVSAGTLIIGNNGTTGSLTGDIVNNAAVQFNRSDAYTYAGAISGTGNLVKAAAGTTTLSGNNSYSGTTTVSAGVLKTGNVNAFGASAVSVTSGAVAEIAGGLAVANNFTINGTGISNGGAIRSSSDLNAVNGTVVLGSAARVNSDVGVFTLNGNLSGAFGLTFGGAGNTTINGVLTNPTTLTKDGAGTLELTAANTYTSTTTVSAGTLKLTGVGTVGAGAITNSAALVVENNDNTTIARAISGTGTLTKNLNTKVIFTGTLSHTGVTTVNAGTLAVGAGSTTGDVSGTTGNFVINSGATLEINRSNASTFARPLSGAGSIVILGGGTASITGALTHTGGTTVSGGTMSIGAGSTIGSITGDIVNNAAVQFNRSDAYTYAGAISGTGNLVKAAAGTTTLSGNNSYSGTTTVSGGVLRMGSANAIGTSSVSVVAANCAFEVTGGLTVANAFTLNSTGVGSAGALRSLSDSNVFSGVLTLGSASQINSDVGLLTLNGNIAGAFALTVGGAGNTVINGVLTNPTTLTKSGAGTLELTAVNTYTSTTTISAGTLKLTGVGTVGAGAITNNASLVIENDDNTTIARGISGTGTLTKNLNTKVIFTGTLSHTGTTTVNAGTFAVGAGSTAGDMSGAGSVVINAGTTLEINRNNASTFSRPLSGDGALVILGGGTASFSGALTHTGGTTVSAGTMSIGAGSTIGSITGDIVNNAAVQFNRSDALSYAGVISGTGNLVKAAAGTLTLTGNSSYAGTTTISVGVLRVGHANALGSATSTVSIPVNTALELTGDISFGRNLSSAGTGVSGGGSLRNISGNNLFLGNYTLTASSRINSDAGMLTLSEAFGTLTGTFGLTFGGAGNITVARAIATGTAAVTKDGTGTLVLSGANTYTGVTTLNGGTTRFAVTRALYNGNTASWTKTNIVVNTGAVFAVNVGGGSLPLGQGTEFSASDVGTLLTNLLTTINNNGLRSGSAIGFDTTNSAGDFTISSNIVNSTGTGAGAVGVVKLGAGVLVLSGSNTYTGGTTINGGTLRAGNSTCFGTGTITLNAGATLDKAGFAISNTIVNNGGTVID